MPKELYLYSPIYDFVAESVNKQLGTVKESESLTFRINSPGGYTNAGFSVLSKLSERKSKTNAIIDGQAKSMGAYLLPFFDYVIANDTSELMLHKAAYSKWYEPTEQEQRSLERTNALFEEKMRKKVEGKPGAESFLAKLFDKEKRNDVELTPMEAKKLGIVDEVRILEPKAFFDAQICAMVDEDEEIKIVKKEVEQKQEYHTKISNNMTLDELKAKHPEVYSQIFNLGVTEGKKAEKDRAEAWGVFAEINPKAVKEGIESGEAITQKAMAEFALQGTKQARIESHEEDNPGETDTGKTKKTAEELKAEADKKAMDEEFEKHYPSKN